MLHKSHICVRPAVHIPCKHAGTRGNKVYAIRILVYVSFVVSAFGCDDEDA